MDGLALIIAFLVVIVLMVMSISKYNLHPFLAIMASAIVLAIIAGIPFHVDGNPNVGSRTVDGVFYAGTLAWTTGQGFMAIFSGIGLVIILGALIGGILEATGGAFKIADMIIRLLGKANPTMAMVVMGWVVSVPVFCDSGFVIINPVRRTIVKRTHASGIATALGLGAGLYTSHVLVPLTPGPLGASDVLGMMDHLWTVMWVSLVISIPGLIAAYAWAVYCGKRDKSEEDLAIRNDQTVKSYEEIVKDFGGLPNGLLSLLPIVSPIAMMAMAQVATTLMDPGPMQSAFRFLGFPLVALTIGFIFGVILLAATGKMPKFNVITNDTLKLLGPILFITAAGATLGRVINDSGMVQYISYHAEIFTWLGLAFPFIISAIIKTAQGSSTVAMITTAGIMMPLLGIMGPEAARWADSYVTIALVVMAIGAGSMMASHANDSYFWVVTKLSDQTPQQGYKNWTTMTVIQGVSVMIGIFIFYGIYRVIA
ncbi:MAG: GntP family permease [Defluviitaleaceae bacterium]|nr:GntP family permease [Defluviitaleaceae bacterium]